MTLLKSILLEWHLLARSIHSNPVSMHTLVPTPSTILGATDASKKGMGGFWFPISNTDTLSLPYGEPPFPPVCNTTCIPWKIQPDYSPTATLI